MPRSPPLTKPLGSRGPGRPGGSVSVNPGRARPGWSLYDHPLAPPIASSMAVAIHAATLWRDRSGVGRRDPTDERLLE